MLIHHHGAQGHIWFDVDEVFELVGLKDNHEVIPVSPHWFVVRNLRTDFMVVDNLMVYGDEPLMFRSFSEACRATMKKLQEQFTVMRIQAGDAPELAP